MKKFRKLLALAIAVCMVCMLGTTAFAGQYADPTGADPRIDKDYVTRVKKLNTQTNVAADNNILNETVTVSILGLSDNVQTLQLGYFLKHSSDPEIVWSDDLTNGDSISFTVGSLAGYSVYVKVTSGNVSTTNPGVITTHISDQ